MKIVDVTENATRGVPISQFRKSFSVRFNQSFGQERVVNYLAEIYSAIGNSGSIVRDYSIYHDDRELFSVQKEVAQVPGMHYVQVKHADMHESIAMIKALKEKAKEFQQI